MKKAKIKFLPHGTKIMLAPHGAIWEIEYFMWGNAWVGSTGGARRSIVGSREVYVLDDVDTENLQREHEYKKAIEHSKRDFRRQIESIGRSIELWANSDLQAAVEAGERMRPARMDEEVEQALRGLVDIWRQAWEFYPHYHAEAMEGCADQLESILEEKK